MTRKGYLLDLFGPNWWGSFPNMSRDRLERAMRSAQDGDKSARTANAIRESSLAFGNRALRQNPITVNAFSGVAKANRVADPRRPRRDLTAEEVQRLLTAAEERPLHDARTKKRGAGTANLSENTVARLRHLGRERRLAYLTILRTGQPFWRASWHSRLRRASELRLSPHIHASKRHQEPKTVRLAVARGNSAEVADMDRGEGQAIRRATKLRNLDDDARSNEPLFTLPKKMTPVFGKDL